MDVPDQVPILIFHILERNVSEDPWASYVTSKERSTSIVNEDMDSAKSLDSSLDNLVSIDYGIVVCNSGSTSFLDLYKITVRQLRARSSSQGIHLRQ